VLGGGISLVASHVDPFSSSGLWWVAGALVATVGSVVGLGFAASRSPQLSALRLHARFPMHRLSDGDHEGGACALILGENGLLLETDGKVAEIPLATIDSARADGQTLRIASTHAERGHSVVLLHPSATISDQATAQLCTALAAFIERAATARRAELAAGPSA
jgi:hypothetical protein